MLEPLNGPLSEDQASWLKQFSAGLSQPQMLWLSGYFAGRADSGTAPVAGNTPAGASQSAGSGANGSEGITILFGSQTGNAESIAELASARAREKGIPANVKSMADYKPNALKNEKNVMLIVSTHGEGDPPDNAIELHEFVHGKRAPKLNDVSFSILALGDTSYEFYCKTGEDFDKQFEKLGGNRLIDRVDCDIDYEEDSEKWIDASLAAFGEVIGASSNNGGGSAAIAMPPLPGAPVASQYNKKNPFKAVVLEKIKLNGRGSKKETYHFELSLEDSGLIYQPGDALAIIADNNPAMVEELLTQLKFDPATKVETHSGEVALSEAFSRLYEITLMTRPFVKQYAERSGSDALLAIAADSEKLTEYLYGREIIDLVNDFPIDDVSPAEFVALLRKMPPRLYSIASSLDAHPEEVHLTVAATRYHSHGRDREGVASTCLADRIDIDSEVPVYIDVNNNFRMPADDNAPMIMVGPGTGIAPFRAFMEEREARGASGRNWLFFGDQHFTTDFLYQIEWQQFQKNGLLAHLHTAFSRDYDHKDYVQHRMLENSGELYAWIQDGAHFYVCGDEKNMAHDVHAALVAIIQSEGGMSEEAAIEYVKTMQKEKRYQRDVY